MYHVHFHLSVSLLNLSFPFCDVQALDLTIAKDERLAVAFFQRSAVMIQVDR